MASFLVPKLPGGLAGSLSGDRSIISSDQQRATKKEKHAVRPPIEHNWSLPGFGYSAKLPEIFQHELIQNFSINMFCKVLVNYLFLFTSFHCSYLYCRMNSLRKNNKIQKKKLCAIYIIPTAPLPPPPPPPPPPPQPQPQPSEEENMKSNMTIKEKSQALGTAVYTLSSNVGPTANP